MPLRRRLPLVHPEPEVRQPQRAAPQAEGAGADGRDARGPELVGKTFAQLAGLPSWRTVRRARAQGLRSSSAMCRLGCVLLVGLPFSAIWVTTASAAFPGQNGRIVFVKERDNSSPLYSVNPDGSRLRR